MKLGFIKLNFTSKIFIAIAFIALFGFVALIAFNIYVTKKTLINKAYELIEIKSKENANINKVELEKPLNSLKNLINSYQGINHVVSQERRAFINQSLKNTLESNPDFIGIGLIWEPNALDGLDSDFVNTPGNSQTGRFLPYFERTYKKYELHETVFNETANWYVSTKNNSQDYFDEPVLNIINNKEILSIRISTPVIIDGLCKGVIFADFSLENIQKINNQYRIFNSGYGQLISSKGVILSNPNKRFINQISDEYITGKNDFVETINKGNYFYSIANSKQINANSIKAYTPFKIGNNSVNFTYLLIVPYAEINQIFYYNIQKTIFLGILIYIIFIVVIYFVLKFRIKPIVFASHSLKSLATIGNLQKSIKSKNKIQDEIDAIPWLIDKLYLELNLKAKFADEIKNGNLEYDYQKQSNEDVFGNTLLEVKQSLIHAELEEKHRKIEDGKRNWTAEGLTKFAEILRTNNNNIEKLSYEVIHNLVKYIDANQGGVFLINEIDANEQYLELTACFAFDRQKFLNKKILVGEGLVGACFLEKQSSYITNIPLNYFNIESGLGDSKPNTALFAPIKLNNDNFGVIEIASFNKIEPFQIEFVEKVAEIFASSISSVKINMKTAFLLEQSQEQAEEMKTQDEEMRQNMEELTATQESLAEKDHLKQNEIDRLLKLIEEKNLEINSKELDYKSKIDQISIEHQKFELQYNKAINDLKEIENNNSFSDLLFQNVATAILNTDTSLISANAKFSELVEMNINEIIGLKLSSVFKTIENNINFNTNLIHYIENNRSFTEKFLFFQPKKGDIWLKAFFYPIFSKSNKIDNILICLIDITEEILTENAFKKEISNLKTEIITIKQSNDKIASEINAVNKPNVDVQSVADIIDIAFVKEEYAIDGKMLNANINFEKLYNYSTNDIDKLNIISLIPEKSKKEFKMIWDSLLRGKLYKGETQRLTKSGKDIWLSCVYFPIEDKNKIKKILFLAIDITDSKKFEKENQQQAEIIKEFEAEINKMKAQQQKATLKQINKKRKI